MSAKLSVLFFTEIIFLPITSICAFHNNLFLNPRHYDSIRFRPIPPPWSLHSPPLVKTIPCASTKEIVTSPAISDLKAKILAAAIPTQRGTAAPPTGDPSLPSRIDDLIRSLESLCPLNEPARDYRMGGSWFVEYTTAPPPSNGVLGPFKGTARQAIDLENGTYTNILEVGPGRWLTATLEATYEEWDGKLLEDKRKNKSFVKDTEPLVTAGDSAFIENNEVGLLLERTPGSVIQLFRNFFSSESDGNTGKMPAEDYGRNCWKVDFKYLSIKILDVEIFRKEFVETSRVWKMTYLDDETRIVRAGSTGSDKDDFVFYMARE